MSCSEAKKDGIKIVFKNWWEQQGRGRWCIFSGVLLLQFSSTWLAWWDCVWLFHEVLSTRTVTWLRDSGYLSFLYYLATGNILNYLKSPIGNAPSYVHYCCVAWQYSLPSAISWCKNTTTTLFFERKTLILASWLTFWAHFHKLGGYLGSHYLQLSQAHS